MIPTIGRTKGLSFLTFFYFFLNRTRCETQSLAAVSGTSYRNSVLDPKGLRCLVSLVKSQSIPFKVSEKLKLDFNCSLNGFPLTKEILDETIFNVSLIFNEAANGTALILLLLLSIAAFLNRHLRFHISLLPMVVITSGILSQICSTVEMRIFKIYKGKLIVYSIKNP